jgi:hypothetical protein
MDRIQPIRTHSEAWLDRHRQTHERHAAFGTHRHPYLLDTVRDLSDRIAQDIGERPSLLDYGCGKGVFLREMTQSGMFRYLRGYDPALNAFKQRPAQRYDLVVCLDVLDQLEDEFVEPTIIDVAQFASHTALFDVITVQTPELAHLNPRSAETWRTIIQQHIRITELTVRVSTPEELQQGACPERVIIAAEPRSAG